jgi:hypothetical protein
VEQALARYAEQEYVQLSPAEQEQARRVFIQLVQPGQGTQDTRRLAHRAEVGPQNWELVTRLAGERLVVTGYDPAAGEDTVEVVHEALIGGWDRLRAWLGEDSEFRTWQERLRENLREWQASERDAGGLLRGALLATAEEWRHKREADLSAAEQEFIAASLRARQAAQQETEAARQRELAQAQALAAEQQRRAEAERLRADEQSASNRRLRQRAVALAVLLLLALAATTLAFLQTQAANRAQATAEVGVRVARAQALAANAIAQLDVDPERSVLLAMEAISTTRRRGEPVVPQAEDALHPGTAALACAPHPERPRAGGTRRSVQPRWRQRPHRQLGRHGEAVGRIHGPGARPPARPRRAGGQRGVQPRRAHRPHRQR